jgi:hypothetical protein
MAADPVALPPGFKLDELPAGFKLDEPPKKSALAGAVDEALSKGLTPTGYIAHKGLELLDKAAYEGGGKVTDVATRLGASPETAAGLGVGTNVAIQAVPMAFGGELGKVASPAFRAGAEKLMQSALKPGYEELKSGAAKKAVETMLDEGISVTQGGVDKLRGMIDKINDAITAKLQNNPQTIEAYKVIRGRVDELKDRVMKQVTPNADKEVVEKAVNEFLNHPLINQTGEIPVELAQQMKQGTYRALGGKSFGELKGADTETQKTLARGLKEEISDAVPGIGALNAQESQLLNALEQVQKRALMEGNKNAGGLAWLAKNPAAWAAFMADKSSAFKSAAARLVNVGQEQIPATAARAGIAGYQANE